MDEAAELLATGSDRHQQLAQGLREKLQSNPDDVMTAITLASCIHTALVLGGSANIEQDMTEMEGLLLPHLAGVQHHPIFLATAGKLLFFLGHHQLGEDLANTALDAAPTHAAVLQIYAQIRMFCGDLEEALEYFDYASSNCEPGSKFHAAIQVMKGQAYRANGKMQQAAQLVNDIVARDDNYRLQLNFALLGDSEFIDEQSNELAAMLNQEQWQGIISQIFHISARPFVSEALRDRAMSGVVSLAHKHIGSACLISELEGSTPGLYQRYR